MSNPYGGNSPYGQPWQPNSPQPSPDAPQSANGHGAQPGPAVQAGYQQPQGNSSPGYPQPGYAQQNVSSPGIPQPGYPQQGVSQPGYPQQNPSQPGYPQPGYAQQNVSSPGIPQPGYPQQGVSQPGYPQQNPSQPGYPQPGYPQPGYPQPGYPQPGNSQPGYPQQGYPQPGYGVPNPGVPQQGAPYGGQPGGYPPANYGAPQGDQFRPEPGPPGIVVDSSYFPLQFLLALTGPRIRVNGQEVPGARWGATHIPVPAGQYQVEVKTRWLWDYGPGNAVVPVADGQSTKVYYRSPIMWMIRGAIGPVPQKTPGMIFMYITWGIVGFLLLLNLLLIAASS
ncbi:hypothetical protein [Nocardia macrotermitis]|uniref:Uncharacterized protein n=1 Tax=Nocardia macrotermitis TaxID=2585198 RepID=A0A7K0D9Q4_9NOCA|nr:hypothetical protein [Nocardia macrotermitis]MQY22428.1 hypothetical protein [Nocardia macrotermitis]